MLALPKRILVKARRSSRDALYGLHRRLHDTVTIQTKQGRLTISTRDKGIGAPLLYGIGVAVDLRILKAHVVARNLALMPQVRAASAVKPDLFTFEGALDRSGVHVTQHYDFAGRCVLSHRRNQSIFV